ncbi:hypothetical protein FIBSPDRAFT_792065 [Athelia psychrophila]|uniref:DUF6533 domain-containing protein n=1 Tax=Athelia psychrophila TaxID=1759441 RepID=A0A166H293_9AGAM|nr:hypothetical protein FIBSPDRAFT_792065 [Fibularhizoctonia sp. CBS 109695]
MELALVLRDSDEIQTHAIEQLLQTRIATYIAFGVLTAATWDWILALAEECQIVKRRGGGRNLATLAYFLARASSVILCVLTLIFYIGVPPGKNSCSAIFNGISAMVVLGNAAKAYIFFLRVRAVYFNSKLVTAFVGVGSFVMVCARMTIGLWVQSSPLGQTGYCTVTSIGSLPIISLWLNVVYDTCIFILTSVRLTSYSATTTAPGRLYHIRGYGLPHTMRTLLQDGQLYYFITIVSVLSAAVIALLPVGIIYKAAFTVPAVVTETIMTCKVFRAMLIRSLSINQNVSVAPAESHLNDTEMGLVTSVDLQNRLTCIEQDEV